MARGLWVTDGDDPAELREQMLSRRRNERQWQATVKTSEGRWVMHREMRTEDGGAIGISTDVTDLKERQEEADRANETARLLVSDLARTLNSLRMGVVLLDASLNAQVINKAFYDIWKSDPPTSRWAVRSGALMDVNRNNGIYDVAEDQWEGYVASRLAEIKAGDVAPREFAALDGRTMIYSVTALSGGKRLVCYYDVTEMKNREADLADCQGQGGGAVFQPAPHGQFHVDRHCRARCRPEDGDHQPGFLRSLADRSGRRLPKDRCSAISWRPAEASTPRHRQFRRVAGPHSRRAERPRFGPGRTASRELERSARPRHDLQHGAACMAARSSSLMST